MTPTTKSIASYKTRNSTEGKGGIPCPGCGEKIAVALEDILTKRQFKCESKDCETVMRLDQRGSSDAIAALKMMKSKMNGIDGIQM